MEFIKFVKKLFKKFDLFPLNFKFTIKDNNLKKTFWGGFFSTTLILITILVLVRNYLSFLSWDNPKVSQSLEYIASKPAEIILLKDLPLIISLHDPSSSEMIKSNLTFNSSNNLYLNLTKPVRLINTVLGQFYVCSDPKIKNMDNNL